MKLRVGLVGLGDAWEIRHSPALRALADRFEVRAVCEEVTHRAEQAASQFDATAVDGYRALANREDIDAILMLSPQWFGALPILAASDAGKAVYCAASLDLAPDEAIQIKQRVEKSGIAFMAEFPRRHAPATHRLKELIATNLGRPKILFCHHRLLVQDNQEKSIRERRPSPATRALLELIDWCRYVVGKDPSAVTGIAHESGAKVSQPDYLMMSLDFSDAVHPNSGPTAQVSCGHYMPSSWKEAISFRPPAALQICCENGVAFVDLPSNLVWFDEAGRHMESLESERPVGEFMLSMFHRAVTSLLHDTTNLDDAYRAISILTAAQQSVRQGVKIRLEDK